MIWSNEALANLGILAAGQNANAEDFEAVDGKVDPLVRGSRPIDILDIDNHRRDPAGECSRPLAVLLADECGARVRPARRAAGRKASRIPWLWRSTSCADDIWPTNIRALERGVFLMEITMADYGGVGGGRSLRDALNQRSMPMTGLGEYGAMFPPAYAARTSRRRSRCRSRQPRPPHAAAGMMGSASRSRACHRAVLTDRRRCRFP